MAREFTSGQFSRWNSLQFIPSAAGISFWMKSTSATANMGVLAQQEGAASSGGTTLFVFGNKMRAFGRDTGFTFNYDITSTSDVNTGAWVHVAHNMTAGFGGPCELYINGALEASMNVNAGNAAILSDADLVIGALEDGFYGRYVGEIAELGCVYGRRLTLGEIEALAKGFRFPNALASKADRAFYAPLIRSGNDRHGLPINNDQGAASDHPRVFG